VHLLVLLVSSFQCLLRVQNHDSCALRNLVRYVLYLRSRYAVYQLVDRHGRLSIISIRHNQQHNQARSMRPLRYEPIT
jgi:hypothetical protein